MTTPFRRLLLFLGSLGALTSACDMYGPLPCKKDTDCDNLSSMQSWYCDPATKHCEARADTGVPGADAGVGPDAGP